jgi:transcriptional regulator with XRE-family HTH domain
LTNASPNRFETAYAKARLREEAASGIWALMEKQGVSRKALAESTGVSKAFISKVLSGNHNFTLDKVAELYFALGRAVHLTLSADLAEFRNPRDEADSVCEEEWVPMSFNFQAAQQQKESQKYRTAPLQLQAADEACGLMKVRGGAA